MSAAWHSGSWWPLLATLAVLVAMPCLQIGLLYKQLWYSNLAEATPGQRLNCTCGCYDGFIEGRAYYSRGAPHFYSSVYRHVYINTEMHSALLLSLMACSVLMLYRAVDCLWRLVSWRKSVVAILLVNLLLSYDLFWSTFQSANTGRGHAALHHGVFYGLQCCLCWSLICLAEGPRPPAPLALNWAAVLAFGPLLIRSANLLTLLQYVSRVVLLRDYLASLGHVIGHAATLAVLLHRLPGLEWKQALANSRLVAMDAVCLVALWIFNILT